MSGALGLPVKFGASGVASGVAKEMVNVDKNKPFLLKLWMMIEEEDRTLIRWSDDGSSFIISDLEAVENQVLPRYFRGKFFSSFQRQLNYFGFCKRKLANCQCSFSHCNFHRDYPEKLILIKRKVNLEQVLTYPASASTPATTAKIASTHHTVSKFNGEYSGEWQYGTRQGEGVMVWDGGDKYEGCFLNDQMHGYGKYTYASGNTYEGTWLDNKKHGQGNFLWKSGSMYSGEYRNDMRHGNGRLSRANGIRQEGKFEDDRFVGSVSHADGNKRSLPHADGNKRSSPHAYENKRRRASTVLPTKSRTGPRLAGFCKYNKDDQDKPLSELRSPLIRRGCTDVEAAASNPETKPPSSLVWACFSDNIVPSEAGSVVTMVASAKSWKYGSLITSEMELTQGRHYWEVVLLSEFTGGICVGISRPKLPSNCCYLSKTCDDSWCMHVHYGATYGHGNWHADSAGAFQQYDRVGVMLDLNEGSLLFFKNGVQHGPGFPAGSVTGPVVHAVQMYIKCASARLVPLNESAWPDTESDISAERASFEEERTAERTAGSDSSDSSDNCGGDCEAAGEDNEGEIGPVGGGLIPAARKPGKSKARPVRGTR
jgi:hypothetical protein